MRKVKEREMVITMMMKFNLYSKLDRDSSYKLIQLTPEILSILKDQKQDSNGNGNGSEGTPSLQFRALDKLKSNVVLCSHDKTWLVRQHDHSNSVLLFDEFVSGESGAEPEPEPVGSSDQSTETKTKHKDKDLLAIANTTYEYELKRINGQLNLDMVPIYNGELDFPNNLITNNNNTPLLRELSELLEHSPCSEAESEELWHDVCGCKINGYLCILSRSFVSKALHVLLVSSMAESLDLDKLELMSTYRAVTMDMDKETNPYTIEVVRTVLNKFGRRINGTNGRNEVWSLDKNRIAKWYGIRALQKFVSGGKSMPLVEFLIKWKSTFPPFFACDIDIDMLRGYYYRPQQEHIQYLAKNTLPTDAKERFQMLFALQSTWDLEDIEPFIEPLNTKGLKPELFVMKYARRRKVRGKVLVSGRSA